MGVVGNIVYVLVVFLVPFAAMFVIMIVKWWYFDEGAFCPECFPI